ncbi:MAG: ribosomal protein S18-alanine N-acetyltransferase [Saccharofermentans sp.]|nr:ribosomal protein S18-alanine N-acetyltransferase [Saccharofermentans sp.]
MIRTAREEDVDNIVELEAECMPHPWVTDDIRSLVTDDKKYAIVAEEDGLIAGYVGASFVLDEAEIGNICVSSSYRRRGFASALLTELEKELKSSGVTVIFLEVESTNTGAIALYEREGFVMYNERKDYYGQGKDALLYRKEIS